MSYQPEERYWTDYLRIALPVVGLLLMLGLFWFWASNLIGDDDDDNPPATVVADNPPPTATPTLPPEEPTEVAGGGNDGNGGAEPTATEESSGDDSTGGNGNGNGEEETPERPQPTATEEQEPPTEPANDGEIGEGDIVVVNSDGVNFRSEPNTSQEAIRELANGEELTVTGPLQEGEGIEWYPVVDSNGEEGFVAAQYVQLAE